MNWGQSYDFDGQDPMGFAAGDAGDAGPRRPRPARAPAAERDQPGGARRGRHGSRPRPARRRRRPLARAAEPAHQDARGGGADREQGGPPRADAAGAAGDRLERPARPVLRAHQGARSASTSSTAKGSGTSAPYQTKPYEFGDPFQLDLHRTIRNAIRRQGGGTPVSARTPTTSRSSAPSTSPGRAPC